MVVHAAFGGSTNLLLHIPAIAFAAGLSRPTVDDWHAINVRVPRLVSVLPNGPYYHPTVRAFLAGGVPEVMLHLRETGPARRVGTHRHRRTARRGPRLVEGERAPQAAARTAVQGTDGVDPDDVIMSPGTAPRAGPDQHRHLPPGQPRPRGLGHQEHGHRPDASSTPTASIARPAPPASSRRETRRHRRDQGAGGSTRSSRATSSS